MFLQSLNPKSNFKYNDIKIMSYLENMPSKPATFLWASIWSYKLSMANIYVFIVAMVTIMLASHIESSIFFSSWDYMLFFFLFTSCKNQKADSRWFIITEPSYKKKFKLK